MQVDAFVRDGKVVKLPEVIKQKKELTVRLKRTRRHTLPSHIIREFKENHKVDKETGESIPHQRDSTKRGIK